MEAGHRRNERSATGIRRCGHLIIRAATPRKHGLSRSNRAKTLHSFSHYKSDITAPHAKACIGVTDRFLSDAFSGSACGCIARSSEQPQHPGASGQGISTPIVMVWRGRECANRSSGRFGSTLFPSGLRRSWRNWSMKRASRRRRRVAMRESAIRAMLDHEVASERLKSACRSDESRARRRPLASCGSVARRHGRALAGEAEGRAGEGGAQRGFARRDTMREGPMPERGAMARSAGRGMAMPSAGR